MTEAQLSSKIDELKRELVRVQADHQAEENRHVTRISELKANIKDLMTEYETYEIGIKATREEDERRAQELNDLNTDLKSRERKLFKDREEFELEKKQFYQTKNL